MMRATIFGLCLYGSWPVAIVTALLLIAAAPAAAQWVDPTTCATGTAACDSAQRKQRDDDASYAESAKHRAQVEQAEHDRQRRALLKTAPLPAERNALLGSWRLDAGQRSAVGGPGQGSGRDAVVRELFGALSIDRLKDLGCGAVFGGGVSFTPSTYTRSGTGGVVGGPIAYRAGQRGAKAVTVAIPNDGQARMMDFEIASASRIVYDGGCVLVRVDAPVSKVAANATTAPGNTRTVAASTSAATVAASGNADAVVDGAAFRCTDGSLLHVSMCQGGAAQATCKLTELHRPGVQMGKPVPRADIAARVKACEAGGIRYGADDKPVFVR